MEWNLTTFVILLCILFAGYGLGLLENYLKYSKKLKRMAEMLDKQALPPEISTPVPDKPVGLHLWNDPEQVLKLELDGEPIHTPLSITPTQRNRLLTLLTQARPWLEGNSAAAAPVSTPKPVESVAAVIQPTPVLPVKIAESVVPAAALNIVEQINDVLQTLLVSSPLVEKRIYLSTAPGGGVLVNIGSNRYEGVDAVPDPEIKALIRQAVAKWEKM